MAAVSEEPPPQPGPRRWVLDLLHTLHTPPPSFPPSLHLTYLACSCQRQGPAAPSPPASSRPHRTARPSAPGWAPASRPPPPHPLSATQSASALSAPCPRCSPAAPDCMYRSPAVPAPLYRFPAALSPASKAPKPTPHHAHRVRPVAVRQYAPRRQYGLGQRPRQGYGLAGTVAVHFAVQSVEDPSAVAAAPPPAVWPCC